MRWSASPKGAIQFGMSKLKSKPHVLNDSTKLNATIASPIKTHNTHSASIDDTKILFLYQCANNCYVLISSGCSTDRINVNEQFGGVRGKNGMIRDKKKYIYEQRTMITIEMLINFAFAYEVCACVWVLCIK